MTTKLEKNSDIDRPVYRTNTKRQPSLYPSYFSLYTTLNGQVCTIYILSLPDSYIHVVPSALYLHVPVV
jgi:hypothetical protein